MNRLFIAAFLIGTVIASSVDFKSKKVSGVKADFNQYTGYISVNSSEDAQLFFWFFESQGSPENDPLVLWMTGGPGCSGELAIFFENGPFSIDEDLQLVPNPYSWNLLANVLYIDQPVGVGFSFANSEYVDDELLVGEDVYAFLQGWFANFNQFKKNNFYIIGESYGGHYVPTVATAIIAGNEMYPEPENQINLVGIAIGNGLVDPVNQDESYGVFGYKYGLINESTYAEVNETYARCRAEFDEQNYTGAEEICLQLMPMVLGNSGLNFYNIHEPCKGQLCYDFSNVTRYLNSPEIQQEIGVYGNDLNWTTCNFEVNSRFGIDIEESFAYKVAELLENGVPVLVYNGMLDLICNYVGGDFWTSRLDWSGSFDFNNANFTTWYDSNNMTAGHIKAWNNFAFLEFEEAGHMVPHDQPERALEMLNNFLTGAPWGPDNN